MSKFDIEQIGKRMFDLEKNVICDILIQERKTHNAALSDLSTVKQVFRSTAQPTFLRSLGGGERTHLSTIRTVKELHSDGLASEQNKKKGIFGV